MNILGSETRKYGQCLHDCWEGWCKCQCAQGEVGDSAFSFQATENAVSLPEFAKTCAQSHTPQSCQSRAHRVQLTEQQQELAPEAVCIQQLLARETRLSLS